MVDGFYIRFTNGRCLEECPADASWTWLSADSQHAAIFDQETGEAMRDKLIREGFDVQLMPDTYWRRRPTYLDVAPCLAMEIALPRTEQNQRNAQARREQEQDAPIRKGAAA